MGLMTYLKAGSAFQCKWTKLQLRWVQNYAPLYELNQSGCLPALQTHYMAGVKHGVKQIIIRLQELKFYSNGLRLNIPDISADSEASVVNPHPYNHPNRHEFYVFMCF